MTTHKHKHTPGPWKFEKELYSYSGEWLISYDAGEKGRGIAIAETRVGSGYELGNARLIAAAPELLEALDGMLQIYGGSKDWNGIKSSTELDCISQARAAIAKATGGEA